MRLTWVLSLDSLRLSGLHPRQLLVWRAKRMLTSGADFLCVGDESTGELSGVLTLHDLLRGESVLEEDNN